MLESAYLMFYAFSESNKNIIFGHLFMTFIAIAEIKGHNVLQEEAINYKIISS